MEKIKNKMQLNSKRNRVYLIDCNGEKYIQKLFDNNQCYYNEKKTYNILCSKSQKLCPQIFDCNDKELSLKIEFLSATTVLDKLIEYEKLNAKSEATTLFLNLFDWIKEFHKEFDNNIILKDVNLRNFIIYDEKIYGIDFELCIKGSPASDFIYAISMYTLYSPINSQFKQHVVNELYTSFFKTLFDDKKNYYNAINAECEIINNRRNCKDK